MSKRPTNRIRTGHIYRDANKSPAQIQNSKKESEKKYIPVKTDIPVKTENIDFDNLKCSKCGYVPGWCDSAAVPRDVINRFLYHDYLTHLKNCNS